MATGIATGFKTIVLGGNRTIYELENQDDETKKLAQSFFNKLVQEGLEYDGVEKKFVQNLTKYPYLLKYPDENGDLTLKLIGKEKADKIREKFAIEEKVEPDKMARDILELLNAKNVTTDKELIKLYNESSTEDRKLLCVLINKMFHAYKEKQVVSKEESKTIALLGLCKNHAIVKGAIDCILAKGKYRALSYLLDHLSPNFLKKHQLKLLEIFKQLSNDPGRLADTQKSMNHEIEPLMNAIVSVSRAFFKSGVENIGKETKNEIYKALKGFYSNEKYSKRLRSLDSDTNYLLIHRSLWALQSLVRIPSDEHKAITFLRKTGEGVLALGGLVDASAKAGGVITGNLSIKGILEDLKGAYTHGKKAIGIKDIPRPWYDMLEITESMLIDQDLTTQILDEAYKLATEYDEKIKKSFNEQIKNECRKIVGKETVDLNESEEFSFGFVGQLSDVAMDHKDQNVQFKALELLQKIFNQKQQSKYVHLFISTTLENIAQQKKDIALSKKAQEIQNQLYKDEKSGIKKPEQKELFRQQKKARFEFLPPNPDLLKEVKEELDDKGGAALPESAFYFGSNELFEFDELEIEGNYEVAQLEGLSDKQAKMAIGAAAAQHKTVTEPTQGRAKIKTDIGNKRKVIHHGKTTIKGDFNLPGK